MTCQTFRSKTTNSPYIYNMYLKTFLIRTFTQHVQHVNKWMVIKGTIHTEHARFVKIFGNFLRFTFGWTYKQQQHSSLGRQASL